MPACSRLRTARPGGYRLYDQNALARLELIRTLRDLGVGLAVIEQIVNEQTTLAEALDVHNKALDTEIRLLRLRRAIVRAMAKYLDTGKMPQMHKLARNTAQERQKIIDEFVEEVFAGVRESAENQVIAEWMRELPAELPADPAPDQIEAWIELGELVADEGFRAALREMVLANQQPFPGCWQHFAVITPPLLLERESELATLRRYAGEIATLRERDIPLPFSQ